MDRSKLNHKRIVQYREFDDRILLNFVMIWTAVVFKLRKISDTLSDMIPDITMCIPLGQNMSYKWGVSLTPSIKTNNDIKTGSRMLII